jgi:hypothetical protein
MAVSTRRFASLTVVVLLASIGVGAPAAGARTDALDKPIYFLHGIQKESKTNCASTWDTMIAAFREWSKPTKIVAHKVEYYWRDHGCDLSINEAGDHAKHYGGAFNAWHREEGGHTNNVRIEHLGYHLAWDIYTRYSRKQQPVDVVAHSMGGLIIRYALMQVALKNKDFPKFLLVEDVVTMGTPHGGSKLPPLAYVEDGQMARNSTFLKRLETSGYLPMGRGGTDWLTIGSGDDGLVSAASAAGIATDSNGATISKYIGAQHKVMYTKASKLGHNDYMKEHVVEEGPPLTYVADGSAQAFVSVGGPAGPFTLFDTAPWPARLAWASIHYGDV